MVFMNWSAMGKVMTPADGIMLTFIGLATIFTLVARWLWVTSRLKWFFIFCLIATNVMASAISFFVLSWLLNPKL